MFSINWEPIPLTPSLKTEPLVATRSPFSFLLAASFCILAKTFSEPAKYPKIGILSASLACSSNCFLTSLLYFIAFCNSLLAFVAPTIPASLAILICLSNVNILLALASICFSISDLFKVPEFNLDRLFSSKSTDFPNSKIDFCKLFVKDLANLLVLELEKAWFNDLDKSIWLN